MKWLKTEVANVQRKMVIVGNRSNEVGNHRRQDPRCKGRGAFWSGMRKLVLGLFSLSYHPEVARSVARA